LQLDTETNQLTIFSRSEKYIKEQDKVNFMKLLGLEISSSF